jgi:Uma2 family endonuclease
VPDRGTDGAEEELPGLVGYGRPGVAPKRAAPHIGAGQKRPEAVMVDLARQKPSIADFYRWVGMQERKYELVDGEPLMMAGASRHHDRITKNMIVALDRQLRGHKCQPFTSDTFVRIPAGNARLPDTGVDCGDFDDDALEASCPLLVVEILSPTNRTFDRTDKLEEYKTVDTLEYILLIDPDYPQVRLYWRDPDQRWLSKRIIGLDASIGMSAIDIAVNMNDIYERLEFRPRPALVDIDDTASKHAI